MVFFFFKQKTAYDVRISDWSSDVCSSDLLAVFTPLHFAFRALAYGSPFPEWFLYLAARICGARVRVIGIPLKRDVFFIANHISWLDILALGGASGTAYVAKAELADRSEEHTSELQSLMRNSYAVFCLKTK